MTIRWSRVALTSANKMQSGTFSPLFPWAIACLKRRVGEMKCTVALHENFHTSELHYNLICVCLCVGWGLISVIYDHQWLKAPFETTAYQLKDTSNTSKWLTQHDWWFVCPKKCSFFLAKSVVLQETNKQTNKKTIPDQKRLVWY